LKRFEERVEIINKENDILVKENLRLKELINIDQSFKNQISNDERNLLTQAS